MARTVADAEALFDALLGTDAGDRPSLTLPRGGARALGLGNALGAVTPGRKADLSLVDLSGLAFTPSNSAARQLVFGETGNGLDTVLVGGRLARIDEAAFRRDLEGLSRTSAAAAPAFLQALRRLEGVNVGLDRRLARRQWSDPNT